EAADESSREVRPCHSSDEADEQNRATGSGAGGAKDRGRGEHEPAKHTPGSKPGKCVTSAGSCTASRKTEEGCVPIRLTPTPTTSRFCGAVLSASRPRWADILWAQ